MRGSEALQALGITLYELVVASFLFPAIDIEQEGVTIMTYSLRAPVMAALDQNHRKESSERAEINIPAVCSTCF
jgi:hypothetical protein